MKFLAVILSTAFTANVWAVDLISMSNTSVIPNSASYKPVFDCRFETHIFSDGWKTDNVTHFKNRIPNNTNFIDLTVSITGRAYNLTFVYNPMGSGGLIGDPVHNESIWFSVKPLKAKINTGFDSYSTTKAHFEARDPNYLPEHFAMRDDFQIDGVPYISRMVCKIERP